MLFPCELCNKEFEPGFFKRRQDLCPGCRPVIKNVPYIRDVDSNCNVEYYTHEGFIFKDSREEFIKRYPEELETIFKLWCDSGSLNIEWISPGEVKVTRL